MIRIECKDGAHYRFWEAEVKGSSLCVHFGRIGTDGQSREKKLKSPAAALAELEKVMRDKLAHGYVKKSGTKEPKKKAVSASEPLLVLAELLAPRHAKTKARVALALEDPVRGA